MKELLADAADHLRKKGQGALQRFLSQLPFLALVTAIAILAVVWGLHETHLLLIRSGVAEAWQERVGRGLGHTSLGDAVTLEGRLESAGAPWPEPFPGRLAWSRRDGLLAPTGQS